MRLETLKLARPTIKLYRADGKSERVTLSSLRILKEAGRIARLVQRKDKAVSAAYLKASPGEIAKRITAEPEVTKVLPMTWTHRESLRAGL